MTTLNRRTFLTAGAVAGAAAAGGIGVALRDTSPIPRTEAVPENDVSLPRNGKSVLLVGGGLSGLITGCELIDRGFDVTVLEKNATLGGRLRSWRDKDFGEPSSAPGWKGHPIEHGTHIVFNFYRNFRDFLARHGLSVRERPINHPLPSIAFAYPDGTFDEREPSTLPAPMHIQSLIQGLTHVAESSRQLGLSLGRKMMAFDPSDPEEVAYLDSVSMWDWCRAIGTPDDVIRAVLDPLMDMGNFKTTETTSALYYLRLVRSMLGHWKDAYTVQFFQDSTDDTIFQPLADTLRAKGGKLVFNAEVEELLVSGDTVTGVRTKARPGGLFVCPICGEVHDSEPSACRRCGWQGGGFESRAVEAEEHHADYYVLGVDIPGGKRLLGGAPFRERGLYSEVPTLPTSSVVVLYLWYPRAERQPDVKTQWEDHFGNRECLMTGEFPMLGTTLNLSMLKAESYGECGADVIETQLARMDRVEGKTEREVADLVDADLRALIPGLPKYTDTRMMRWDNFSCGTVGAEAPRPELQTAFSNLLLVGDWIATEQNCFLMEKVTVNSRRAVNHLLDAIGQRAGKMTILPSETPNLVVTAMSRLTSIKPEA